MYRPRNCLSLATVLLAGLGILGSPAQSDAAYRVTINATGAANPYYYYSSATTGSFGFNFSLGNFSAAFSAVGSNYSGTSDIGTVNQTLLLFGGGMVLGGDLSIHLEVISAIGSWTTGQITNTSDIATLVGTSLATWTAPVGNPLYLNSDIDVTGSSTSGLVYNETTQTIGGVTTLSSLIDNLAVNEGDRATYTTFNGLSGYTLSSRLVIQNINAGASGSFAASSSVSDEGNGILIQSVPAPPAILMALFGVPAFGLIRRWNKKAPPELAVA